MEPDKIAKIEEEMDHDEVLGVGIVRDLENKGIVKVEITRRREAPPIPPVMREIDRAMARRHRFYDRRDFASYVCSSGTPGYTAIFCDPHRAEAHAALDDRANLDSEVIIYQPMGTPELALVKEIKGQKLSPKAFAKLCRRLARLASTEGQAAELRLMAGQLTVTKEAKEATGSGSGSVHGRLVKIEAKGGAEQTLVIPDVVELDIKPYLDSPKRIEVEVYVDLYVSDQGIVFELDVPGLAVIASEHFAAVIEGLRADLPGFYAGLGSLDHRPWRVVS